METDKRIRAILGAGVLIATLSLGQGVEAQTNYPLQKGTEDQEVPALVETILEEYRLPIQIAEDLLNLETNSRLKDLVEKVKR